MRCLDITGAVIGYNDLRDLKKKPRPKDPPPGCTLRSAAPLYLNSGLDAGGGASLRNTPSRVPLGRYLQNGPTREEPPNHGVSRREFDLTVSTGH